MPTQPKVGRSNYHVYIKTHTATPTAFVAGDLATGISAVENQVTFRDIEADAYDYPVAVKLPSAPDITLSITQYFSPSDVHLVRLFDAFKSLIDTPNNPTFVDVLVVNGDPVGTGAKNFYTAGTYRVTQAPFGSGGAADVMSAQVQLSLADAGSYVVGRDLESLTGLLL